MLKKNSAKAHLPLLPAGDGSFCYRYRSDSAVYDCVRRRELGEVLSKTERACLGTFVKMQLLS